jgi:hypothetical protein
MNLKNISDKNIILNQIIQDGEKFTLKETIPVISGEIFPLVLSIDSSFNLQWISKPDYPLFISSPQSNKVNFNSTKFDIAVSENEITTAFHMGDGKHGFSFGNGTLNGFLPEIIGMGKTENDVGLYFLGRAGNHKKSDIPLIVIDGRGNDDKPSNNRPIFGITNADYNNYLFLVNPNGNIEVDGEIKVNDITINDPSLSLSLIKTIKNQQEEIEKLKLQVYNLYHKLNIKFV